ncbi:MULTISPECIES: GrpB family protein [unclassified Bacillus (in: firmicutes)]|uniref:GrpB family protein n=1 Tax=unclassified Bacillus (in: firmicutes) TaxID=185979 RepID=UPI0008F0A231|nr:MULTISPECIES: GrpB family protein [unclassified Bacillus (in: firmicutes)]SFA71459.1 GrpB domain, predicted nucleotidyltransferase, UPF0157 family [Bacillus sp. UNCCL13]SFQ61674.1 GrpB domain, predicted nucleotidyltransferase, UPF0157 family [Bacillus sp. cl95]
MRGVEVLAYQECWKDLFIEEAKLLQQIFGDELVAIHHIGSTSVEGLSAKPIIDMMPVVKDISRVDLYDKEMIELGYNPKGEFGIEGRRYFNKGGDARSHHVHVFEVGSPNIVRHIAFRDYLREHPENAKQYGDLKSSLAAAFPNDMESYINGKNDFVKKTERDAVKWYESREKK